MPARSNDSRHRIQPQICAVLSFIVMTLFCGCVKPAGDGGGGTTTTTPPNNNYQAITGNWVISTTATGGPFTTLSGFINEVSSSGSSDFTTAALVAQSTGCYATTSSVSLEGSASGAQVNLTSFQNDGQVMSVFATRNMAGNQLTGNYSVVGGCANGASGNVFGTLYDPLNGTYSGPLNSGNTAQTMQLTMTQAPQGDGAGRSFLSGTVTFQGTPCFASGTLSPTASYVIGNQVTISATTADASESQVLATGTFDSAGDTIAFSQVEFNNGACAGPTGTTSLTLQQ